MTSRNGNVLRRVGFFLFFWLIIFVFPAEWDIQAHTGQSQPNISSIGLIQGRGDSSPYLGQEVVFESIVTGVREDVNSKGIHFHSLYVQDLPGREDGDKMTSDGISVFTGVRKSQYKIGDVLEIRGRVIEYFGLTEIDDADLKIRLLRENADLPPAVNLVEAYLDSSGDLEYLEAMRVEVERASVMGPTFQGCGFAISLTSETDRFIREEVSDLPFGLLSVIHTSDADCGEFPQVNVGDVVEGLAGPLSYEFGSYKLVQQGKKRLSVASSPIESPVPLPAIDTSVLRIVTLNAGNFFDNIDDTGLDSEPKIPSSHTELKRQKIAAVISQLLRCPGVIGIQEVEKALLLNQLGESVARNCRMPYDAIFIEGPDSRGANLGLLVNRSLVSILSLETIQFCEFLPTDVLDRDANCLEGAFPLFSRPPLQVTLDVFDRRFVVLVNHFKSKREGEAETEEIGKAQARAVQRHVVDLRNDHPDISIIVMGDFNDYFRSNVSMLLTKDNILHHALGQIEIESRYSYNFAGSSQLLDWILVTSELQEMITGQWILHTNADFAVSLATKHDGPTRYLRSSDHDIPAIDLAIGVEGKPLKSDDEENNSEDPLILSEEEIASTDGVRAVRNVHPWRNYLLLAAVGGIITGLALIALWNRRR